MYTLTHTHIYKTYLLRLMSVQMFTYCDVGVGFFYRLLSVQAALTLPAQITSM